MKPPHWKNWSIRARMLVITALPLAMIIAVIIWSYVSRIQEINRDLRERGNLIAATLAESSQYAVISGNALYLRQTIRSLLQIDSSIYSIEVLGSNKKPLVQVTSESIPLENMQVFEAPIHKELFDINAFGNGDQPHLSDSPDSSTPWKSSSVTVGSVVVKMSAAAMLADKRMRILTGTAIALGFLLLISVIAFVLARDLTKTLATIITAVRRIREGRYDPTLPVVGKGEIAELQLSIIEMSQSLEEFRKNLECKVEERTRALADARDKALKANAEKRRLIQKVTTIVEEERQNIAIDIHDHLNAAAIVVKLELQRIFDIARRLESDLAEHGIVEEKTRGQLQQLQKLSSSSLSHLNDLYRVARDIVKRLRPEVLDTLGLRDAIDDMVTHYDNVHPKCRFELAATGDFSEIDGQVSISAYRLVQEALSNIVKHSSASNAKVELEVDSDQGVLWIDVSDDGVGFDINAVEKGVGMLGMRERVLGLLGDIHIHAVPGAGTTLIIALPIRLPENIR